LETHNFDGLDLDYEFPVASDKDNFGLFVKELREGLGYKYELTAATSATPSKIAGNSQKVPKLAFFCTYIFLILIFPTKHSSWLPY
jgi:GH18 family chitinase